MKIKNIFLLLFSVVSIHSYSQKKSDLKWIKKPQTDNVYLDSIKKTFVVNTMASCVDSLWLKELNNLDLYNGINEYVKTVNVDKNVENELPTELLKARLKAMDAKSPFHIEYSVGLENIIKSFLKNRKKAFGKLMAVSEYYFPIFEDALAKKNVPLEIKYLAVVESSLNPKAVSRVGATGLWQFMYQTGKQYNLNIDSYVDERSDPLKSSEAAAQYMANMYAAFGDWDLVLASYNSGPGNVVKAIRRSDGQQNYWNIRKNLPQETQGYVPAFLATMYIFEYHKQHGIVAEKALVKHFETDTIRIRKEMSFKQISDLIDVPVDQLETLNPSYKLNVIPNYVDSNHYLRLPREKMGVFVSNEKQIYAYLEHDAGLREIPFQSTRSFAKADSIPSVQYVNQSNLKYYKVQKGDNLNSIAERYNVSVDDLKKWNGLASNSIGYGKSLKISTNESVARVVHTETKVKKPSELVAENSKVVVADASYYVVQKGDNLVAIAKKYNVTVEDLKDWNNLSDNSIQTAVSLQVGKNAIAQEDVASTLSFENVEYIVKKGDNLGNISKKYGATIENLREWNNLQDNTISLGNSLIVARTEISKEEVKPLSSFNKKESLASTSKKNPLNYLVQKGDSLYSIAKKYPGVTITDIKKWNDIRSAEELKPGMKLKING